MICHCHVTRPFTAQCDEAWRHQMAPQFCVQCGQIWVVPFAGSDRQRYVLPAQAMKSSLHVLLSNSLVEGK